MIAFKKLKEIMDKNYTAKNKLISTPTGILLPVFVNSMEIL